MTVNPDDWAALGPLLDEMWTQYRAILTLLQDDAPYTVTTDWYAAFSRNNLWLAEPRKFRDPIDKAEARRQASAPEAIRLAAEQFMATYPKWHKAA
jgi:hypothetical protein